MQADQGIRRPNLKTAPAGRQGLHENQKSARQSRGTIAPRAEPVVIQPRRRRPSPETEQGQGTGSRNVAHGEGSVGQVGTTGVEVAGAGVGPGGAFSEGELGDEDRGAFDGGRGFESK